MDCIDADMMDSKAAAAVAVDPQQQAQNEVGKELLIVARNLIDQGKPSQALRAASEDCIDGARIAGKHLASELVTMDQTKISLLFVDTRTKVVMAMRTRGGDEAAFQLLYRAREVYRTRMQENTAVDRLASLFAECVIAEVQPSKAESLPCNADGPSVALDAHGTSILAETGRMQIVLDAFSDGSSFICLECGGLVSNYRKEEHYAYWCGSV